MYIAEGHNLIARLFYSFGSIIPAVFMFICTIILGELFYFLCIAKMRKKEGRKSGVKYFIWRIIFYFYLMMTYIQTGMVGAFWWAIRNPTIRLDRIYLIPFTTSPDIVPYLLNILMTVPLGFLLPFIWSEFRSVKKVAISAFFFSFAIEFTQLFSARVSSTSDLIMNTTGAVIGYGIFYTMRKLLRKNPKEKKSTGSSKLIKNEGPIYIVLSFIGIVFLNHPAISMQLPQTGGYAGIVMVDDSLLEIPEGIAIEAVNEILGDALEVLDDRIIIRRFHIEALDNDEGLISISNSNHLHGEAFPEDEIEEIFFTETTDFTIYSGSWQDPTITTGSLADIEFGSQLSVYGYYNEEGIFIAIEIKIMRVS